MSSHEMFKFATETSWDNEQKQNILERNKLQMHRFNDEKIILLVVNSLSSTPLLSTSTEQCTVAISSQEKHFSGAF